VALVPVRLLLLLHDRLLRLQFQPIALLSGGVRPLLRASPYDEMAGLGPVWWSPLPVLFYFVNSAASTLLPVLFDATALARSSSYLHISCGPEMTDPPPFS